MGKPIIVQSDMSILLEVKDKYFEEARNFLIRFCELIKSPEYFHTYYITPLSIWNAAFSGMTTDLILSGFEKFSKYAIPNNVLNRIKKYFDRVGKVRLFLGEDDTDLILEVKDKYLIKVIENHPKISPLIMSKYEQGVYSIHPYNRGIIKKRVLDAGFPVTDEAGFTPGTPYQFMMKDLRKDGTSWSIRKYQTDASDIFFLGGKGSSGYGVIVLPCGSGKTIVGISVMEKVQATTLILTTNIAACHQWINELVDKTTIPSDDIGEYTGNVKQVRPITICTYNIIVYANRNKIVMPHFEVLKKQNWGLVIFDEVHLLPAPVFRLAADIQSRRRLGLTATLVREDGKEKDIFSLIGPKRFDIPWKDLEKQNYIAEALCYEYKIKMDTKTRLEYLRSSKKQRFMIASKYKGKVHVIEHLLKKHSDRNILIIGQYLDQLKYISEVFNLPLITGKVKNSVREELYSRFKHGEVPVLVVSKVANFAIDLPDASVAIQVSGTFGSRQEEAQRLGRILRPKKIQSFFYTVAVKDSIEEGYSYKRQMFLVEQGYKYNVKDFDEMILSNID